MEENYWPPRTIIREELDVSAVGECGKPVSRTQCEWAAHGSMGMGAAPERRGSGVIGSSDTTERGRTVGRVVGDEPSRVIRGAEREGVKVFVE